jgi:hypothetical protein
MNDIILVKAAVPISSECRNALSSVESWAVGHFVPPELRYWMFRVKIWWQYQCEGVISGVM